MQNMLIEDVHSIYTVVDFVFDVKFSVEPKNRGPLADIHQRLGGGEPLVQVPIDFSILHYLDQYRLCRAMIHSSSIAPIQGVADPWTLPESFRWPRQMQPVS